MSDDSENQHAEGKISIDIYQGKVEFRDQFIKLAEKYEEENPDVSISVTAVGGGTDYFTSLRSRFSAGDEPEIFSVAGPSEAEDFKQYLSDLSDTKAASLALEGTLDGLMEGEQVYGLPFNQEGYGLIYNKKMFEEAGIDAEKILTYEDLEEAVQKLDSQKDELGIEEVFALPANEEWVISNHLANTFIAPEFNNSVMEAYESGTVPFEKSEELKRILDLQNTYSIQPTLSMDYSQQVEQYFTLEKVAIIQQGNWIYPTVAQMDQTFAEDNLGILPIPVEGHEGKLPVGVPNYWVVNDNKDDEVVEASKDFLNWMYTSEEGKEIVLNDLNFIPAYEGFDTSEIADPLSREIYEYSSKGYTIDWVFVGFPTPWTDSLGANMQEYIDGGKTWEEVIEDSRREWEGMRQ